MRFQTIEEIIAELNPSDTVLRRLLQKRGVFLGDDRNVRQEAQVHLVYSYGCKEELLLLIQESS